MKKNTRKLVSKILAIAMAAFMCIGTFYYVFALFAQ